MRVRVSIQFLCILYSILILFFNFIFQTLIRIGNNRNGKNENKKLCEDEIDKEAGSLLRN